MGDVPLDDPNITKLLPSDEETTLLTWEHSEVVEIHHRRYTLKNNPLEIFLVCLHGDACVNMNVPSGYVLVFHIDRWS